MTTTHPTSTPTSTHDPLGAVVRAAPWLAAVWVAVHSSMGLLHLLRDTVPPWRPDPASLLASFTARDGSALVVALAVLAALALALVVHRREGSARTAGAVLLVTVGLVVALVLAGAGSLAFLGYAPMLLLGLLGVGPAAGHLPEAEAMLSSLLDVGSSVGGLAMVVTGALALRRTSQKPPQVARARALAVGRWAVGASVIVPLCYAITRLAWTVGLPLGVREEFLDELGDAKWAGFGLAAFAVVGGLLTLGLVQRWGEVFWRWVPVVGGRPVPVAMAVVPALLVATTVVAAGLGFWAAILGGHLDDLPGADEDWAAWAPELLWPLWGVALAVAALAYRARRTA